MVELVQLINPDELEFIKDLLEKFEKATDSEIAKNLLSDWPAQANQFVKVSFVR